MLHYLSRILSSQCNNTAASTSVLECGSRGPGSCLLPVYSLLQVGSDTTVTLYHNVVHSLLAGKVSQVGFLSATFSASKATECLYTPITIHNRTFQLNEGAMGLTAHHEMIKKSIHYSSVHAHTRNVSCHSKSCLATLLLL